MQVMKYDEWKVQLEDKIIKSNPENRVLIGLALNHLTRMRKYYDQGCTVNVAVSRLSQHVRSDMVRRDNNVVVSKWSRESGIDMYRRLCKEGWKKTDRRIGRSGDE